MGPDEKGVKGGKAAKKANKEVKRRDVSEREPMLVGPHDDPAMLPKNLAELEVPKNNAGRKTSKNQTKHEVREQVQNRSGPDENVTKIINHEQEVANMVADENWTEIRSFEEDVSEERSKFPVISVDSLRPRNDPMWDTAD